MPSATAVTAAARSSGVSPASTSAALHSGSAAADSTAAAVQSSAAAEGEAFSKPDTIHSLVLVSVVFRVVCDFGAVGAFRVVDAFGAVSVFDVVGSFGIVCIVCIVDGVCALNICIVGIRSTVDTFRAVGSRIILMQKRKRRSENCRKLTTEHHSRYSRARKNRRDRHADNYYGIRAGRADTAIRCICRVSLAVCTAGAAVLSALPPFLPTDAPPDTVSNSEPSVSLPETVPEAAPLAILSGLSDSGRDADAEPSETADEPPAPPIEPDMPATFPPPIPDDPPMLPEMPVLPEPPMPLVPWLPELLFEPLFEPLLESPVP